MGTIEAFIGRVLRRVFTLNEPAEAPQRRSHLPAE
jgi:hypothetical protein